jgi:predicted CoA-substrate-specific enzyme activase
MIWFMGIDIGSGTSKGVITGDGQLKASHVLPSGIDYHDVARQLREELLAKAQLSPQDISYTVATGHGAASADFSQLQVADLRCCARGINSIFPSARTVIDIGEQSSHILKISGAGRVVKFVASERCAAGSGRFLAIIANVLRIDIKDIGPLSLKAKNPVTFTTGCAVFGESEAVSRVAEGISKEDIVAGVHQALANKISALIDLVGLETDCAISGGGGLDVGLIRSIEAKLGIDLLVPPQPQIVTALGAAIMAEDKHKLAAASNM